MTSSAASTQDEDRKQFASASKMASPAAFTRTLERSGSRLLIRSACQDCGDSKLVSQHDGTLQEWEDGHRCGFAGLGKKEPTPVPAPSGLSSRKIAGRTSSRSSRENP